MKMYLMCLFLVFSTSVMAKGRIYRQYVGGFSNENADSEYKNASGAYIENEFDYASGYLSKAQSISYYEASSHTDGAIDDPTDRKSVV